jgi:phthiodiolone/phenolphthiodiolone dimycocerosates ketoreductase
MTKSRVQTAIAVWADRNLPPRLVQQQCQALQTTGALDGILLADQFTNFIPEQLWTAQNTPMAAVMPDPDSHPDVFVMAAYIAAAAPGLHLSISTDSVRRGPAELITTMLTLANITEGQVTFQVGGGEIKQTGPFGHPTNQGMSRMEDLFRLYRAVLDSAGKPFDYRGRRWTFEHATLGGGMPHRPSLYGLGAGPTLLKHTAAWADGLAVTCPPAWECVDRFATERRRLLDEVERLGRNPDDFRFAIWFPALLADSQADLEPHLANPIIKWLSALFGRIDNTLWKDIGLPAPLGEDFVYYKQFLPYRTPDALIDQVIDTVTPEHTYAGWVCGTPEQVADQIQPYIDAGADWVCPMDYLPMVLEPEAAQAAGARSIELCDLIHRRNPF